MISEYKNQTLLKLYIQPGASKSELVGPHGDRLKIKISAPPIDGSANEALIKYLSKLFNISKSRITLLRGETSRNKDILLDELMSEVESKLNELLQK